MKIFTIYKATNVKNGKVYIGFDSCWPKRISNHKCSNQKEDTKFYRAIRKHGFDSFVWESIYQSWDGEHTLKVMEPFFILEYDSFNNGYNSTLGGDGVLGLVWTKEQRDAQSISQKGVKKPRNPNLPKRIMSQEHIQWFVTNVLPLAQTKEARENISKALKGKKKSKAHIEAMKSRWQDNTQITCPHCNKTGEFKVMHQWHMDRCKNNPNRKEDKLSAKLVCEHCNYTSNRGPNFYRYHGKNCKFLSELVPETI